MSRKKAVAVLVAGVLIGLMVSPLSAQAALTINKIWRGIMPKADARYLQQFAADVRYVRQGATAYALVKPDVTFDASRTYNFTAVSRPSTGVYCLTPAASVDAATRPAVVSPEYHLSSGTDLQAYPDTGNLWCSQGDIQVVTRDANALSNNTAFTVWVP